MHYKGEGGHPVLHYVAPRDAPPWITRRSATPRPGLRGAPRRPALDYKATRRLRRPALDFAAPRGAPPFTRRPALDYAAPRDASRRPALR